MAEHWVGDQIPPKLTVENVMTELEGLEKKWEHLGIWLSIPESKRDEIRCLHPDSDEQCLRSLITHWLSIDPCPSWRALIRILESIILSSLRGEKEKFEKIRSYAEPLTDPTLTAHSITTAITTVEEWKDLSDRLGVPWSKRRQIDSECSTLHKKKEAVVLNWLQYQPGPSWTRLAHWLYYVEEQEALHQTLQYLKRPTEPTLTMSNVYDAIGGVHDCDWLGSWLGVPESKLGQLGAQSSDSEMHKQNIIREWLSSHPAPSWDVILEALYKAGYNEPRCHSILMEVKKLYGKEARAAAAAKSLYEQALKFGYIQSHSIICVLTGAGGSGKTHLKYLLFRKKPPKVRVSTALMESPVRAISFARVNTDDDDEWHEVDDDEQCKMIAEAMAAGDLPTEAVSEPTSQDRVRAQQPQNSGILSSTAEQSTLQTAEPTFTDPPTTGAVAQNTTSSLVQHPQPPQMTTMTDLTSELDHAKPDDTGIGDDLVKLIMTSSCGRRKLLQADRIYLFDSGGQSIFHELLRLFLRRESVTIFVIKLNERLDQHPMIEYYGNEGKLLNRPRVSPLTHEDILKHSFRAVQSQVCAQSEQQKNTPKLLVVGTHRDKEWWCSENRREKNDKLKALLAPAFQKMLLYYGEGIKELIFPVNTKNPGRQDQEVAKQLRKAILSSVSSLESHKTPLRWHLLEMALRRLAASKRRSILSRQECLQVARQLHLSVEELDAAFDHLSQLNLILYYRKLLPRVIFTDLQVVVDKVTELVKYSYTLQGHPDPQRASGGELLEFRDEGIITLDFLAMFSKHYESSLLSPSDLVSILEHRLIIARVSEGRYFMPSLLLDLPVEHVQQYRVKPSSAAAPLVVHFPDGVAPSGVFCSLVASLLSPLNPLHWELLPNPSASSRVRPACVARNCIKFKLPGRYPGSVALIDAYTHFEVHVSAPGSVCADVCPHIQIEIFRNLTVAAEAMHYSNLAAEVAFLCEFQGTHAEKESDAETVSWWRQLFRKLRTADAAPPPHAATISTGGSEDWWTCILDPDKAHGKLEPRHTIWRGVTHNTGEFHRDCDVSGPAEVSSGQTVGTCSLAATTPSESATEPTLELLDEGDQFEITTYLTRLDKTTVYLLGQALGLNQWKVKQMRDSETFVDDVIAAWLRREDHVEEKGMPTWRTLVRALRHPRIEQNGLANDISRDKGL